MVRAGAWVLAAVVGLVAGCAPGPDMATYVAPKLAANQAASLEGKGGVYVSNVDGAECKTPIKFADFGGNSVVLAPGVHRVTIMFKPSGSFGLGGYSASMKGDVIKSLQYTFVAGHQYEVSLDSRWNIGNKNFVLEDKSDGSTKIF